MEILVVSRISGRAFRSRQQANASKPRADVAEALRAQDARRIYEQAKFHALRRNLTNPLFNVHL